MTRAYRRTIETPRIATTFPAGQFEGVVLAFSETPALVVENLERAACGSRGVALTFSFRPGDRRNAGMKRLGTVVVLAAVCLGACDKKASSTTAPASASAAIPAAAPEPIQSNGTLDVEIDDEYTAAVRAML
jgi:hypothetical protein